MGTHMDHSLQGDQWHSQEFDLGVYVLTSHCNFKTCVNVPYVNKSVTDFGGYILPIYPPPVATPLRETEEKVAEQHNRRL